MKNLLNLSAAVKLKESQLKLHKERMQKCISPMKGSFWYSVKQHELYQRMDIKVNYIIGYAYTELTAVGKLPTGNFDDYTIVFENLEYTCGDIENHNDVKEKRL
jgi:hypothetical protein